MDANRTFRPTHRRLAAITTAALMLWSGAAFAASVKEVRVTSSVTAAQLRKAAKPVKVGTVRLPKHGLSTVYCAARGASLSCAMFDRRGRKINARLRKCTRAKKTGAKFGPSGIVFRKGQVHSVTSARTTGIVFVLETVKRASKKFDAGDGVSHTLVAVKLRGGGGGGYLRSFDGFKIIADTPFRKVKTAKQAKMARVSPRGLGFPMTGFENPLFARPKPGGKAPGK